MKSDDTVNKESKSENNIFPAAEGKTKNDSSSGVINLKSGKSTTNRKALKALRSIGMFFLFILILFFSVIFILYGVPALEEVRSGQAKEIISNQALKQDPTYKKQIGLMTKDIQLLSRKYSGYSSGQSYIVINTTDNRFFLYTNKKLVREGFCSSGSYTMLQTAGNKKWIFKTPKGKYWIRGKTTNPVWKKPDWAFVEEGLPIPSKDDFSRYEYGVLGDYALAIGDGYLIHGTIYKRFLGMPVTHGCVRLNDEDLKAVFNTLSIGSKVYIF